MEPIAPSIISRSQKDWSIARLRRSISDLNIASKVKSVIGRKRSREEDDEEFEHLERERPVKKALASTTGFWQNYRDLHVYHNELEALVAATVISHTYDEANGLHMLRDPPYVNLKALAALEGEQSSISNSTSSSFSWSEHMEDIQCRLGLRPRSANLNRDEDLTWAGDEVDDFRCFVRTAGSSDSAFTDVADMACGEVGSAHSTSSLIGTSRMVNSSK